MNASKFLIAAANSGAGKTTLTLGLMEALKSRGKSVQPFKCGPDYIDTKLHKRAAGKTSINLDLFLSSPAHVQTIFKTYSEGMDVSVVEGVMGLFDGYQKDKGSAAAIAKVIDIPIILVVNAKASAYSVAALLYGFKHFDSCLNVVGAIFNFVGSDSHYSFLKDACQAVGIEALGYLPKNSSLEIPSRYLGLNTDNSTDISAVLTQLGAKAEAYIDIDRLLQLTTYSNTTYCSKEQTQAANMQIAVAHDEAFNFVYEENMRALRQIGHVSYFSPIHDSELPEADFIYIPGGYPEHYAQSLSENIKMHQSIKKYVEAGGKLLAECGGMMYLSSALRIDDDTCFPMVGIFNQESTMVDMKLKLGYRYFDYQGVRFRGHEFHYSRIDSSLPSVIQQYNARGKEVDTKLLRYKNALAGYTHLYWADNPEWMKLFND